MTDITVELLAKEMQVTTNYLLSQLANIKIYKNKSDSITLKEKENLLLFLKKQNNLLSQNYKFNKFLHRKTKTRSTLSILGNDGKSKLVNIEIRKKLTYINSCNDKYLESRLYENKTIKHCKKDKLSNNELNNKLNKKFFESKNELKDISQSKSVIKDYDINIVNIQGINKSNIKKESCINKVNNSNDNQTNYSSNNNEQINEKKPNSLETDKNKVEKEKINKTSKNTYQIDNNISNVVVNKSYLTNINEDYLLNSLNEKNINNYKSNKYLHYHNKNYKDKCEHANKYKIENEQFYRNQISKISKNSKNTRSSKYNFSEEKSEFSFNNNIKTSILTQSFNKPVKAISRNIIIGETITVSELANKMAVQVSQVIKTMIKLGTMVTINQIIDQETAQIVAEEMGHKVILRHENELEKSILSNYNNNSSANLKLRAPIVTIMGHVDHGKTSLLDCIRSTNTVDKEYGGITQHINAYHVNTKNGKITFIDTPGHAAFTTMRARGAKITDIVLLIVAADDGVMPQTVEAIKHAKNANVPIIVAINKIDKSEVKLDLIENELMKYGIIPEKWGGENQFVYVSAKSGNGIDEMINAILLQAEMLELKTIYDCAAKGVVIESSLNKGRGPSAVVIILEGTLNKGDIVLCGFEYGRIRAMRDEFGNNISSAIPSVPVEILGLSGVPYTGNEIVVVHNEKKAKEVALYRQSKFRETNLANKNKHNLENVFINITKENKLSEINIILKSDVQGTSEAIKDTLNNLSTNEIKLKVISSGIGEINESDVTLASTLSNVIIIGFNVKANTSAKSIIKKENINFYHYSVIYELIDKVKKTMNKMLKPKHKREIVGIAEIRNTFCSSKFGNIAGCIITNGIIKNHSNIRIIRNNLVIYEGEIESIRRFKENVNEVRNGTECGIGIRNYNGFLPGDIIEVFEHTEI